MRLSGMGVYKAENPREPIQRRPRQGIHRRADGAPQTHGVQGRILSLLKRNELEYEERFLWQ